MEKEINNILVYKESTDYAGITFNIEQYKDKNNNKSVPVFYDFDNNKLLGTAKLNVGNDKVVCDLYLFKDVDMNLYPALGFLSNGSIECVGLCNSNNLDQNILRLSEQIKTC